MTSPQPARSKTQLVYDHIIERVVSGEYPGGMPLHIGRLAEETRVSLIPVREALRLLESEGIVIVAHHRGARIAELDGTELHDVMQTQAVLEALAVAQAAPFFTAEDLAEARSLNQKMDEAHHANDPHEYHEASLAFHAVLQRPCPNAYLRASLERGKLRIAAARAAAVGYYPETAIRLSEEHSHLLNRIEAGAPSSEIEQLMRDHRESTVDSSIDSATKESGPALLPVTEGLVPARARP